jgi:hypothetical protein
MAISEALSHPFLTRRVTVGGCHRAREESQAEQSGRLNTPNILQALEDETKDKEAESTALTSSKAITKQVVKTKKLVDLFREKLKEERAEPGDYMIEPNRGMRLMLIQLVYFLNYIE